MCPNLLVFLFDPGVRGASIPVEVRDHRQNHGSSRQITQKPQTYLPTLGLTFIFTCRRQLVSKWRDSEISFVQLLFMDASRALCQGSSDARGGPGPADPSRLDTQSRRGRPLSEHGPRCSNACCHPCHCPDATALRWGSTLRGNEFVFLAKLNEISESLHLDTSCLLQVKINVRPKVGR